MTFTVTTFYVHMISSMAYFTLLFSAFLGTILAVPLCAHIFFYMNVRSKSLTSRTYFSQYIYIKYFIQFRTHTPVFYVLITMNIYFKHMRFVVCAQSQFKLLDVYTVQYDMRFRFKYAYNHMFCGIKCFSFSFIYIVIVKVATFFRTLAVLGKSFFVLLTAEVLVHLLCIVTL